MSTTVRFLDTSRLNNSDWPDHPGASTWYIEADVGTGLEREVESAPVLDRWYTERGREETLGEWRPWRPETREIAAAWVRNEQDKQARERAELEARAVARVDRLLSESVARIVEMPALQRWEMGASVVEADRAALLAGGLPSADVDNAIRAGTSAVWRAVALRAYMAGHAER